ncbi:hypothetical protein EJB05_45378, partial [Eragrostis curvula]
GPDAGKSRPPKRTQSPGPTTKAHPLLSSSLSSRRRRLPPRDEPESSPPSSSTHLAAVLTELRKSADLQSLTVLYLIPPSPKRREPSDNQCSSDLFSPPESGGGTGRHSLLCAAGSFRTATGFVNFAPQVLY